MSGSLAFATTSGAPSFSVSELTTWLLNTPIVPSLVGSLNLFVARPISTTSVAIERRTDSLALVPAQPRGAPANRNVMGQRDLLSLRVPHFPLGDTVYADSIQDVRGSGSAELQGWTDAVRERLASMSRKLDATEEHLRFGAVRGIIVTIVDRENGAPLQTIDLFAAFGIAPPAPIDFPMSGPGSRTADAAWSGAIMAACRSVMRTMQHALQATPPAVAGICGSDFFDALSGAAEVRQSYLNTSQAGALRENTLFTPLEYGGIRFYDYGHASVGTMPFMAPDRCQFVAVGVPDLFAQAYAPAPYVDAVNSPGLPRYARSEPLDFNKGVALESQLNTLPFCTKPETLLVGRLTAAPGGAAMLAASAPPANGKKGS